MYVLDFTAFIYDHVCFRNVTHNEIYNRVKFAFKELSKAFWDKGYIGKFLITLMKMHAVKLFLII